MTVERIARNRALRAARAKLPILNDRALQANLDLVIGGCCSRCTEARSLAEAYRIGVEEAQREIVARIAAIDAKPKEPRR